MVEVTKLIFLISELINILATIIRHASKEVFLCSPHPTNLFPKIHFSRPEDVIEVIKELLEAGKILNMPSKCYYVVLTLEDEAGVNTTIKGALPSLRKVWLFHLGLAMASAYFWS